MYCIECLVHPTEVSPCQVEGVIIWGNHSATQFPDLAHATVTVGSAKQDAIKALNDDKWVQNDFIAVRLPHCRLGWMCFIQS